MIKNYLKVTFRNLSKNKWFSLINVIGLTVGITCSLIIYLHISQELSFDNFHEDGENIYRITRTSETSTGIDYEAAVPYPLIEKLKTDFSQFEVSTQIHYDSDILATYNNSKNILESVIFADSNFFDVFSFKVLNGNTRASLAQPGFCFITPELASVILPNEEPIGKKIRLKNTLDLEIAGIIESAPVNSHLQFDLIASYPSFSEEYLGLPIDQWSLSASGYAYVRTLPEASLTKVEEEFKNVVDANYSEDDAARRKFYLQPLKDVYYDSTWNPRAANTTNLWSIGVIGIFILLIGCINFINLASALALKKSKEVGIRKALGAARRQLVYQSLSETFIVSFISSVLAVGITELLIPFFNNYFGVTLILNVLSNYSILLFLVTIIILVTILAGLYPAFVLSGYNPVKALKNNMNTPSTTALILRKSLIGGQFVISQILIICTIVVANQMEYFRSKPLGFDTESIINVGLPDNDDSKLKRFKDQLLAYSNIEKLSFSVGAPSSTNNVSSSFYLASEGRDNRHDAEFKIVDHNYLETYGLELKYGRWFRPNEEAIVSDLFAVDQAERGDQQITYIINEKAAKQLGFVNSADAIGEIIITGVGDLSGEIVGVISDYHLKSLHEEIEPAIMINWSYFYFDAGIKISTRDISGTIAHIEATYKELFPEEIFEYSFLDDSLAAVYEQEERTYSLFSIFSIVSILISCLGLLGMISFVVTQRTKEIGVRKVLGAKVSAIVGLFSIDFMKLVGIAFFISTPIAWYVMNLWLQDFAYSISIQVWVFVVTLVISAIITFVTISIQSVKAAIANPVEALRDE